MVLVSRLLLVFVAMVRAKRKAGTVPLQKRRKVLAAFDAHAALADLELEVEDRCKTMRLQAEGQADALWNFLSIELTKLPIRVRSMPMAKFSADFDGNLEVVLQYDREKALEATLALGEELMEAVANQVGGVDR